MKLTRFSLRAERSTIARARQLAAQEGCSIAAVIRDAINGHLERLPPQTDDRGGPSTGPQRRFVFSLASKLDRKTGGMWRHEALTAAAGAFGRKIASIDDLTEGETSWTIDWLKARCLEHDVPLGRRPAAESGDGPAA